MRRHAATVLVAFAAATTAIGTQATPVSAECVYGATPWPEITGAIPTAREIVVGEVVTDVTNAELDLGAGQEARAYALRVTHVIRGEAQPGDLIDIQFLLPNWPQTRFAGGGGTVATCTYLRAEPGEVIALAFDALQPGGPMSANDRQWTQPPTRYHAVGVIRGPGGTFGTGGYRQRVTLSQLRYLASLPSTDMADPARSDPVPLGSSATTTLLIGSLLGLLIGLRRSGAARQVGQRVAPDGVRRSER